MSKFKEIYSYRQMLKSMVLTDLRTRYKGSVLGFLWTFLNPLLLLVIYSVVFSIIMRMNIENYPMFLFVAMLPWTYFQSAIMSSSGIIIRNGSLVKKIFFPREILPISTVLGAAINYLFGIVILIPSLIFFGISIKWTISLFPIILIIQTILTLGISYIVSALTVFFRDLEHIIGIIFTAAFYITPIIYPVTMAPEKFQKWFYLNPMTTIVESYRDILFYGKIPSLSNLSVSLITAVIFLLLGQYLFSKMQKRFAEEI
ncbi:ABC transporter permease [Paenibacillus popilliae]|uniref:Transport permease protein n=1 Tax=Paenibacillus popilliae TaxID=78057 RepID=A0ABY3AMJ0_PAEPP|nr:ABC transporter permease [Paenibacillus sp. SDF0028]TQR43699.1 ABC transporter permease [Paenibacillus sp. SDF0028]